MPVLLHSAAGKLLSSYKGQLPTRLWIAPPTRMDEKQLIEEGYYSTFGNVGARTETPGCSLCMGKYAHTHAHTHWTSRPFLAYAVESTRSSDLFLPPSLPCPTLPYRTLTLPYPTLPAGNQARVADKSTVVSTSTRNFPNRLGKGANVFLASAELASIAAIEGKLPSVDEYQKYASKINETSADTFRYLNFDRLSEYVEKGKSADLGPEVPYRTVLL